MMTLLAACAAVRETSGGVTSRSLYRFWASFPGLALGRTAARHGSSGSTGQELVLGRG